MNGRKVKQQVIAVITKRTGRQTYILKAPQKPVKVIWFSC